MEFALIVLLQSHNLSGNLPILLLLACLLAESLFSTLRAGMLGLQVAGWAWTLVAVWVWTPQWAVVQRPHSRGHRACLGQPGEQGCTSVAS